MFPFTTTNSAVYRIVYDLLFSFGITFKRFSFKTVKG